MKYIEMMIVFVNSLGRTKRKSSFAQESDQDLPIMYLQQVISWVTIELQRLIYITHVRVHGWLENATSEYSIFFRCHNSQISLRKHAYSNIIKKHLQKLKIFISKQTDIFIFLLKTLIVGTR